MRRRLRRNGHAGSSRVNAMRKRRRRARATPARERAREAPGVPVVTPDPRQDAGLVGVGDAHLDGVLAEQRHLHLALERDERRVGPGEGRVVGDVGQRLRVARVRLAGRVEPDLDLLPQVYAALTLGVRDYIDKNGFPGA